MHILKPNGLFVSKPALLGLSFFLGFSGIIYELVLAQLTSLYLGGTYFVYGMTFGVFTFFLGISTLYSEKLLTKIKPVKFFSWCQGTLALTLIFFIIFLLFVSRHPPLLFYIFISAIGFITGTELPIVFKFTLGFDNKSYAFDYLGMVGASFIFAGYLIFNFNLILILGTVLTTQCLVAFIFSRNYFWFFLSGIPSILLALKFDSVSRELLKTMMEF